MKQQYIWLGIFTILIGVSFYLGYRSANANDKIQEAKNKAKLWEIQARKWQDSSRIDRSRAHVLEEEVALLSHEADSLEKVKNVIITRTRYIPTPHYQASQLDSLWKEVYKDEL